MLTTLFTVLTAVAATPPAWVAPDAPTAEAIVPTVTPSPAAKGRSSSGELIVKAEKRERTLRMEMGFRLRSMSVPRDILDAWYTDSTDKKSPNPLWPLPGQERPFVHGINYGLEWTIQDGKGAGVIWLDWTANRMPAGYWDDREEPPAPTDGDVIRPSNNVGIFAFGADYMREVQMVKLTQTKGAFGMSLVVGGGLGVGMLLGRLDEWSESNAGVPAYEQVAAGEPPTSEKSVPRVYPMVDASVGLKFNFGDRAFVRFEGGLHTLLFYGGSVGVRF